MINWLCFIRIDTLIKIWIEINELLALSSYYIQDTCQCKYEYNNKSLSKRINAHSLSMILHSLQSILSVNRNYYSSIVSMVLSEKLFLTTSTARFSIWNANVLKNRLKNWVRRRNSARIKDNKQWKWLCLLAHYTCVFFFFFIGLRSERIFCFHYKCIKCEYGFVENPTPGTH